MYWHNEKVINGLFNQKWRFLPGIGRDFLREKPFGLSPSFRRAVSVFLHVKAHHN